MRPDPVLFCFHFYFLFFGSKPLAMLLPVYVYLIPLFDLIAVLLSLLLHFNFAVWRTCSPCPCFLSGLSCTA